MGTKLVANRNITVTGTSGSSITFKKGVPTHVPDQAVEDCMKAGAIPAEGETLKVEKVIKREDAPQGVERKQRILDAIDTAVILNERGTFNANGAPKQHVLEKTAGFVIDTREVDALWHEYDKSQKQGLDMNVDAATITDPAPVITENEDTNNANETVETETKTEANLGGQAVEGQEASDKPAKAIAPVDVSRNDMRASLSVAGVAFPGNISNVKLKELYDALPS